MKASGKVTIRDNDLVERLDAIKEAVLLAKPKSRASRENIARQVLDAALSDARLVRRLFHIRIRADRAA